MQVGVVGSMNFKGTRLQKSYEEAENQNNGLPQEYIIIDMEEAQDKIDKIREFEKEVLPKKKVVIDENGEAHEIKSPLQTAVSLAATALIAFAFTKKIAGSVINNEAVHKLQSTLTNAFSNNEKLKTVKNTVLDSKKLETVKNSKPVAIATEFVNSKVKKHGKAKVIGNVAGAAGATAATIYASRSDSNNDGVADIAQKGVNWYEGALKKGGAVAQVIDALT